MVLLARSGHVSRSIAIETVMFLGSIDIFMETSIMKLLLPGPGCPKAD